MNPTVATEEKMDDDVAEPSVRGTRSWRSAFYATRDLEEPRGVFHSNGRDAVVRRALLRASATRKGVDKSPRRWVGSGGGRARLSRLWLPPVQHLGRPVARASGPWRSFGIAIRRGSAYRSGPTRWPFLQSITAMDDFTTKSFEELRLEDRNAPIAWRLRQLRRKRTAPVCKRSSRNGIRRRGTRGLDRSYLHNVVWRAYRSRWNGSNEPFLDDHRGRPWIRPCTSADSFAFMGGTTVRRHASCFQPRLVVDDSAWARGEVLAAVGAVASSLVACPLRHEGNHARMTEAIRTVLHVHETRADVLDALRWHTRRMHR